MPQHFKLLHLVRSLSRRRKIYLVALVVLFLCILFTLLWIRFNPKNLQSNFPANSAETPRFLYALYGDHKDVQGTITNTLSEPFKRPMAVVVAPDGRIFVADSGRSRIEVFGADGKRQLVIGEGSLKYPVALAYAGNKLYVADPTLMKVAVFDNHGKELKPLLDKVIAKPRIGDSAGNIVRPSAIQSGPNNLFYITDVGNHSVWLVDAGGQFLMRIASQGIDDSYLEYPGGVWVGKNGDVYVADSNNGRVQIYNKYGLFLTKIDGTFGKFGHLALPRGIAVLQNEQIIVVDTLLHRVRAFDAVGNELWSIGGMGSGNGLFYFPNSLCLDAAGKIYVADRENNRIEVFGY
ncbi:MAG: hypothetical protein WA113_09485 [Desulfitobacteriaceae bacterium]